MDTTNRKLNEVTKDSTTQTEKFKAEVISGAAQRIIIAYVVSDMMFNFES
jgi:hypothetical protein